MYILYIYIIYILYIYLYIYIYIYTYMYSVDNVHCSPKLALREVGRRGNIES